jgi:hypothetical protein
MSDKTKNIAIGVVVGYFVLPMVVARVKAMRG